MHGCLRGACLEVFPLAAAVVGDFLDVDASDEGRQALAKVMQHLLKDDMQVYKQFVENESFKRLVGDMVYALTSQ